MIKYTTDSERTAARKKALHKYNTSEKRKSCSKRYYESHTEELLAKGKVWRDNNKGRMSELQRLWLKTEKGKALRGLSYKRYCDKNKHKRLAKDALNNEIKAGRLKRQGCSRCHEPKAEAHHPDYNQPLKVIWLCRKCHVMEHSKE